MIRRKLQQFMIGRAGGDQFSLALLGCSIVFNLLSSLLGLRFFYWLYLICICYALFRVLSRNVSKRRASSLRNQMKDKEHRYFRCPNCKQQMRVPKGKGRIQVTCRNCGVTFEEKS